MDNKILKFWNNLINRYYILRSGTQIGEKYHLEGICRIYGQTGGKIRIGHDFRLVSKHSINPVGSGKRTVICAKNGGQIEIGNHVGISHSEIIAVKHIKIEDNVMIGGGCCLLDSDHHPVDYRKRISNSKAEIISLPIVIKEGAFIGAHSIILKGVTIGAHSIVGAGSVVTKSIPDNEIWGGNPAKFIRRIEE